jgi:hypothetical protein
MATMGCMANSFGASVAVRIARLLYRHWEGLAPEERQRLEPLAGDVKERALEVRGKVDDGRAERELEHASSELAPQLLAQLERMDREQRARRAA